jgi:hypothetical protein
MNREVNLTKRIRTSVGLRYCRVAFSANGRIKPNTVLVNGKQERHSEGAYYLEWRQGTKRVRLSVGKDAQAAARQHERKQAELIALNNALEIVPQNGHRSLAAAAADVARLRHDFKDFRKLAFRSSAPRFLFRKPYFWTPGSRRIVPNQLSR